MLLLGERPAHVEQLTERLRKLSARLFGALPSGVEETLSTTSDLYAHASTEQLYRIERGNVGAYQDGRLVMYFEPGDLIGLTDCYRLPSLRLAIEESVDVTRFEADTVLKDVNKDKESQAIWSSFLLTWVALMQDGFARYMQTPAQTNTGFLNFAKDEVIIEQGASASEVFTILSGSADVFVDGTHVGEVLQDEIFGAMAVFTGEPRSATVKAREDCSVLAVPKEEFISLIQSHPQTTMTMIENMARRIQMLNQQLTEQ